MNRNTAKTSPMTDEAWDAYIHLPFNGIYNEAQSEAFVPIEGGGCIALYVGMKNPNSFPRSWSNEEREESMKASAFAMLMCINADGDVDPFKELFRGEKAFALWDDHIAQQKTLGKAMRRLTRTLM